MALWSLSLLSCHGRAGTNRDSDSVVTGKFPGILLLGVVNLSLEN